MRYKRKISARVLSVSQKTHVCIFFDSFVFVAKRYILQQKCLDRQIGTCLLWTHWYRPGEPQCSALRTDWRSTGWCQWNSRSQRSTIG